MFHALNTSTNAPATFLGAPCVFADGALAAKLCELLKTATGIKHRPARIPSTADWRARERERFNTGEYEHVPWHEWHFTVGMHPDHFPHASKKRDGLMAYTPSEDHGQQDRQVRIRPGAYLQRYYSDRLDADDIREFALRFSSKFEDLTVKFATTPDEIERVYVDGPRSCMSKPADCYDSSEHPVRVYAGPDLQVAYLETSEGVTARALVRPERKAYGRVYGDEGRLARLLDAMGHHSDYGRDFEGARMALIEDDDGYVCPYLDQIDCVDVEDGYLVMRRRGELMAQSTNGLISTEEAVRCERCEEPVGETYTVQTGLRSFEEWCECCTDNSAFVCDQTSERWAVGNMTRMWDGSVWSDEAFERYGFTCDKTGDNYHTDCCVMLADGREVCVGWFDENGFHCEVTEKNYENDCAVYLTDGRVVSPFAFEILKAKGEVTESDREDHGDQIEPMVSAA